MKFKQILLSLSAAAGILIGGSTVANADSVQYTIKPGNTVSQIATALETTTDAIAKDNKIANVNMIFPGEKIKITSKLKKSEMKKRLVEVDKEAKEITEHFLALNPVIKQSAVQTVAVAQAKPAVQRVAAPVVQRTTYHAPAAPVNTNSSEASARAFIANKESGGSYTASNGRYYGKYQLDRSYLGGDLSPANQERVANNYVTSRYGSWANAKAHWYATGWY
ncbi:LysM peptidoglycan-binding domain-containing protein [Ligilactobacillus ceti]|uniref:Extracellular surface protein n=1 Tax=Ligilactobacillus ceti DSM 22408 TaxID=1122146 RepID=A0A0R2KIZ4_9LACO|nr:LysM peptidoglycan-binding domain-containing protein [Ligilactobacillus ceti]KRN89297.1 extracellular surface protein [Ligilactobacillus ceti DSM 22408]